MILISVTCVGSLCQKQYNVSESYDAWAYQHMLRSIVPLKLALEQNTQRNLKWRRIYA
jgi:hypothetical protein